MSNAPNVRFLSVRHVAIRLSVSPATIWRWSRERTDFPKPIRLSNGCTRWREADLAAFETHVSSTIAADGVLR
jgi:prophage regulatory protein